MKNLLIRLFGIFSVTVLPTTAASVAKTKNIVLVHGFLDTGSKFSTLKKRLDREGYQCIAPSLRPSDARRGVDELATQLKREIDSRFGPDEKITLIGFSMGGIISRYYLQELGGAARCEALITLSSPHHGTLTAWCYPGKGAWQMRRGSPFLAELQRTEDRLGDIPIISYRTPLDLVILPTSSSIWDRAENISNPILMHPLMVRSNTILTDISSRLR